jgi:hypothetical protein
MPVLMVFETITEVICASLEIACHIYLCFILWHVIIITVLCLTDFILYAYVPSVALILMHLVCIWRGKINLSNF